LRLIINTYFIENVIVGNLAIKADPTFGGGNLQVVGNDVLIILFRNTL
jgi:hypothetical protein